MAKLKPWFHVIQPREDLREGRPIDASEFAVHLDHVRENRAPKDYQQPDRFFERTKPLGSQHPRQQGLKQNEDPSRSEGQADIRLGAARGSPARVSAGGFASSLVL
jgi:hypothetical protein